MTDQSESDPSREDGSVVVSADHHLLRIRRILQRKIVPSLALDPSAVIPSSTELLDRGGQSDAIVAMALQGREEQAMSELSEMSRRGMSFEQIQIGLLATAARRLGTLWESDSVSFVDVTVAMGTLQRLMRFVALDYDILLAPPDRARSILLFPEPDAYHTFGAAMAARFFTRAGWAVDYVPDGDPATLRSIVSRRKIDVIGVSLTRRESVKAAGELVRMLKAASRNRDVVAIAGGNAITENPLLFPEVGADAAFVALPLAPDQAARLSDRRGRRE